MSKKQAPTAAAPRFIRSANVELDCLNPNALNDYLLTSGARQVLERIIPCLSDPTAPRAWTLTGPYGTGKSSFAVFIAQLFSGRQSPGNSTARSILADSDEILFEKLPTFGRQFKGLMPVTVTGSREPLQVAILRGLKTALTHDGGFSLLARRAGKMLEGTELGDEYRDRDLLDLISATAEAVAERDGNGLMLIVDELGKLLEFAAAHPSKADLYLLQHLSEMATRSSVPILIVTILHKDFSGYADRLSSHERAEWEKVRGRFEDIVFEESADEVLRLVALARKAAMADGNQPGYAALDKEARKFDSLAEQSWKLGLAPAGMAKAEFLSLIKQCWPLHPLVSVLLGPVFRKLAQNERSLFSFLSSREPHGLLEAILSKPGEFTLYGLDRLYDYLWNSIGEGLYAQRNGKKWAEVEGALDRLENATPTAVVVLKMIGVISAIGGTKNIQAKPEVIAFGADGVLKSSDVSDAIHFLDEASVITTRKYNNTLSLWEGSDVDIDERVKAARDRGQISTTLAGLASRFIAVRPVVARRHSFDTGTLRYFAVEFVDPIELDTEAAKAVEADGRILVVLPANVEERVMAEKLVKSENLMRQRRVVVAVPSDSRSIDMCVRELAYIEWVRENTPELAGDLTARKELRARVSDIRQQLNVLASNMLVPPSGSGQTCEWFHAGRRISIASRRSLNDYISETCSTVFSKTPRIPNELVNRRDLSSQAAAARRNLIERMIEREGEIALGIEGFPPEKSMYMSVLETHGLHRLSEDGWEFGPPWKEGDAGMRAVWAAIQSFFDATETQPATVENLFDLLRAEPYGLRDGLLPILLCAALIANDSDVALYEDGTFVPQLSVVVFERLMKSPSNYQIRRWRISGVRVTVFRQMAEMLGKSFASSSITKRNVLDVVRPLLRFVAQLPDFTKVTEQVSKQSQQVRAALMQAREADQLLFVDLARACGLDPIPAEAQLADDVLNSFLSELRRSLGELQRHYEVAVGELGQAFGSAFGIPGNNAAIRERLTARAKLIRNWVADPAIKNFVARVIDESTTERAWIESISALLSERPPNLWRDMDRAKFDLALTRAARSFRNIESLTFKAASASNGKTETLRIGVTSVDGGDAEEVVHIGPEDRKKLTEVTARLQAALDAIGLGDRNDLALAALAQIVKMILPSSGGS